MLNLLLKFKIYINIFITLLQILTKRTRGATALSATVGRRVMRLLPRQWVVEKAAPVEIIFKFICLRTKYIPTFVVDSVASIKSGLESIKAGINIGPIAYLVKGHPHLELQLLPADAVVVAAAAIGSYSIVVCKDPA